MLARYSPDVAGAEDVPFAADEEGQLSFQQQHDPVTGCRENIDAWTNMIVGDCRCQKTIGAACGLLTSRQPRIVRDESEWRRARRIPPALSEHCNLRWQIRGARAPIGDDV